MGLAGCVGLAPAGPVLAGSALCENPVHAVPGELPLEQVALDAQIAHQDIVYRLVNGERSVPYTPIDFARALTEMESLTHGIENFMCIDNRRIPKGGFVQFIRIADNEWYVDIPIDGGYLWNGYVWGCETDTARLVDALRLFFEEGAWFHSLPWKMSRVKCD